MNTPLPFPEARRNVWSYIKHYTYGLFAKSFNGGISAVDAGIGLAVGSVVSATVAIPTWQAMVSVFCVSFGRSALMYFKDHPIPEKLPVIETIIETTTTSKTPAHEESPATPPTSDAP